jgi:hypothetical protein
MTALPPRPRAQRRADTLAKLESEVDLWVASADESGAAYLVPLSFHWDGSKLTLATPTASRTGRNLLRAGRARVALGPTRDVVIIEGPLEVVPTGADPELEAAYAAAAGWDPSEEPGEHVYLRLTPETILAWRESNELTGRRLMRGGEWLDAA